MYVVRLCAQDQGGGAGISNPRKRVRASTPIKAEMHATGEPAAPAAVTVVNPSQDASDGVAEPAPPSRWTPRMDAKLQDGVRKHGAGAWEAISGSVFGGTKTPTECKTRWESVRPIPAHVVTPAVIPLPVRC